MTLAISFSHFFAPDFSAIIRRNKKPKSHIAVECGSSVLLGSPPLGEQRLVPGLRDCSSFGDRGDQEQTPGVAYASVQLDAEPILLPTVVKVVFAFWPRVVMAARQTTMIKANMTAYSTAVGPSSRATKSTTKFLI